MLATEEVIRGHGVNGVSPTSIAKAGSIPASAIYQYFENSDAVLRAYMDREFGRLALTIAEAVMALEKVSFRTPFHAVAGAHIEYFWSHPEMIALWIEGRLNPVVAETVNLHNSRLGRFLDFATRRAELVKPETPRWASEVAVASFDRVFVFAFAQKRSKREQQEIFDSFFEALMTYADLHYANKRGIEGIPSSEFVVALGSESAVEPADFWAGTP